MVGPGDVSGRTGLGLDGDGFNRGLWFRLAAVTFVLALYGFTTVTNFNQERAALNQQIERLTQATVISAESQTRSIFDSTAHSLEAVAAALKSPADTRPVGRVLAENFFSPQHLWALLYLDARGWVTDATSPAAVGNRRAQNPGNQPADFAFFKSHRDGRLPAGDVFTGDLVVGSTTKAPHVLSSIGDYGPDGDFRGVVAAAYELTYFRDLFARLVPNQAYTIGLFHRDDGLVIASDSRITRGQMPQSPRFQPAEPAPAIGDGSRNDRRFFRIEQAIEGYPYKLGIVADKRVLTAELRRGERFKLFLGALFVLTVGALSIALESYIRTRRRALREKIRLEDQLRQSQKMEALGTLAGGLAHDFNNMLSAIVGFAEMVRDQVRTGTRERRYIDQVLLAGRRAEALVDHILTFAHRAGTERPPMLLNAALGEAVELIRVSAPPNIKLETVIDQDGYWIEGNLPQIVQVLLNLANNAIQAMPEGGTLKLTLGGIDLTPAKARRRVGLSPGPHARIEVADTGQGISADKLDRIFDPFFTTKERGKGTGLGLSIVHRIVTAHGGWIGVASDEGEGTTITLLMPRSAAGPAQVRPAPAPILEGSGLAVLFIDDDDSIVTLGEEYLANQGFEPLGFSDSAAALAFFEEDPWRVGLVISDCAMPHPDGLDITRRIKTIRPDLPIILVTGDDPVTVAEAARDLGVSEIVRKPLRQRRLATSIYRALGDRILKRDQTGDSAA